MNPSIFQKLCIVSKGQQVCKKFHRLQNLWEQQEENGMLDREYAECTSSQIR